MENHGKSRENWIKTMEKLDEHRDKLVKTIEHINEKPFKMKKTTEQMMKIKVWYKSMKPMKKTHIQKHHGSIDENRGKMMNIVKKTLITSEKLTTPLNMNESLEENQ